MKLYIIFVFILMLPFTIQGQELAIYELLEHENTSGERFNFISLTDRYPYSEHPDSLAVPDAYLGYDVKEDYQRFKLDTVYRKRFLNRSAISETDTVFIYNYALDSLVFFKVKDLDVTAIITPYDNGGGSYSPYDYLIGFEINAISIRGFKHSQSHSFVYVGKENPFAKGGMKPLIWEKMEPSDFPRSLEAVIGVNNYVAGDTYMCTVMGIDYFIQDASDKNRFVGRCLIVLDAKSKALLYETIFYNGESASAAPLNLVHPENGDYLMQWTGTLFKNKPPVVFGFQYESFGCAQISFIDLKEPSIYTRCDNRH